MILSTSFSNRAAVLLLASSLFLSGCVGVKGDAKEAPAPRGGKFSIAVFPIENLSGRAAPRGEIRESLIRNLKMEGFQVLDDDALEKFMARNRIRYTGGIDRVTAQALRMETGVEAVLITSIELYSEEIPPKIALISRLVSTGDNPVILWTDGVGLAGDDSPGILGLGLIEDSKTLMEKALHVLSSSITNYFLINKEQREGKRPARKFRPKIAYRSPEIGGGKKYTVAVVPFFNIGGRKFAGEIMLLHFIRSLKRFKNYDVIEPGIVRQELLRLRIIIEEGVSFADATLISSTLGADWILNGKVMDYQDYAGSWGKPKVDFSAVLIERKGREVVWNSTSHNEGDDGVFFFDRGRVNTAYAMASQMTQMVVKMIGEETKSVQGAKASKDRVK